jgi:hypothetical protein
LSGQEEIVSAQMIVAEPVQALPDWLSRREDRVLWELHIAVIEKIHENPVAVVEKAKKCVAGIRKQVQGTIAQAWLDEWERAASDGPEELIELSRTPGSRGNSLRQVSPFIGVLSNQERWAAIRRASRSTDEP